MATATASSAKSFTCNGCGSPLKIPSNSRGKVTCPSCKTDCVIEGLVKNAEMAEKENINSGVSLSASSAMLHKKLVSYIAETPGMPLDVFDKATVIQEEHHCIPAYLFHATGTAHYSYEAAKYTTTKTAIDLGDRTRVETEKHRDWQPMNGVATVSVPMLVPGNREMSETMQKLFTDFNQNVLVDFEDLDYPPDVVTHRANVPVMSAFNEFVRPHVEEMLEARAASAIAAKETRDLDMGGGSNIQKDDDRRLFLGAYRIVLEYEGKEYAIWVTGNGHNAINEGMPVDPSQKQAIDNKVQSMERDVSNVPVPTTTMWTVGKWVSIIVGLVGVATIVLPILGIIGAIICHVKRNNIMAPYNEQCSSIRSKYQGEIDSLQAAAKNIAQQFRSKKQPLRGVYENEVAGDASAF